VGTGPGTIVLDGDTYSIVASTRVVIDHDGSSNADLAAMKIDPLPAQLPVLEILSSSPVLDEKVTLIGKGRNRGAFTTWGNDGWEWASPGQTRWGTNLIGGLPDQGPPIPFAEAEILTGNKVTQALVTDFTKNEDPAESPHECHVATGDSGGALFYEPVEGSGNWFLAGINFARSAFDGQPADTSIYDNHSYSVDLAHYRLKVLDVIRPCDDGEDNDLDGDIDSADTGCLFEGDDSEVPACSDGFDNDFDGDTDYPADADCSSADDLFEPTDLDADFVADESDNCLGLANPAQLDTNQDGYGNACDPDYTNDGFVGLPDFSGLSAAWGKLPGQPGYSEDVDATGDGLIGLPEFNLFSAYYNGSPGPSGHPCAGSIPCP
jgi:hypothetical protein